MSWVPLHCHSQYSILDATCSIKGLVTKAKEYGLPALALTDHGNLYGIVDFYKECTKQGIRPILGSELYVAPRSRFEKKRDPRARIAHHLILLCKNEQGYRNLCLLSSLGFTEGFYYFPRIDKELLAAHAEGLVCMSACLSGSVAQAALESEEALRQELLWYQKIFKDDFFSEVQLHEMSDTQLSSLEEEWLKHDHRKFVEKQKVVNTAVLAISQELGIPSVVTNDIHYINPEDWYAHEVLLNVQSGGTVRIAKQNTYIPNPKRKTYPSREYYFKSPKEMAALFPGRSDLLTNTLDIAKRCELKLDLSTKHYPVYIPESLKQDSYSEEERYQATSQFLMELCEQGLNKYTPEKLSHIARKFPDQDPLTLVKNRLKSESEVIISKGMSDYLLIVWDIISWAKANNIPVGPGRGSGAGSVMLFLLGITEIEPIRFDLFFERFINPERISYPDIDIDICMAGRERVINQAIARYGKDNVAQIITFGTMKAKMAIKDVGRALDVPLAKVNHLARHIPDLNATISKSLEGESDLYQLYVNDPESAQVIDTAMQLEGCVRNTGVHAAGVIMCGEPLTAHIPICISKDSAMITTQYSMKPVESVGMLKVDFLGLKTLTSIQLAISAIHKRYGILLEMASLPLDDKTTFAMLHQGKTMGVFQMESKGMQELAKSLRPDTFEEIIAIGALYRPGPMDMIPSFIDRKHGREVIEYDHPLLEPILKETFGIMVYQEQVMQIAGSLAHYSPGEGDVLRRAMGKKDVEQMVQERSKFCERSCNNGINPQLASTIFDKMEKFASYGFNKSHAAAYGLITYTTAYLKANYPKEWLAALLTSDSDDIDKVGKLIHEAHTMGIQILPPDINESGVEFIATDQGIRFAMGAIKGIGKGLVESILEERDRNGPYRSIVDFINRSDLKKVSKKQTENLIDAGCFAVFEPNRDVAIAMLNAIYDGIAKEKKEAATGVMTFFSLGGMHQELACSPTGQVTERPKRELLRREKELLGIYLTEHPMDAVKPILHKLSVVHYVDFEGLPHGSVIRTVFIIEHFTTKLSAKGQRKFAILRVSDNTSSYELPIWPEMFAEQQELIEEDRLIYAVLSIDKREESLRLSCRWMHDLTTVDEHIIRECDAVFDRIKLQTQYIAHVKDKPKEVRMSDKKVTVKGQPITLVLQLDQLRHSHLYLLKQILHKYRGGQACLLQFIKGNRNIASITPDADFALASSALPQLREELQQANLPITIGL